jgi:rhamnosyl/mannosyltransferase
MKILQIPNYQYPHIGGIEQVSHDIANVLSEDTSIEQKMICFNEDAKDGDYVCHRKETVHDTVDGVEVIRCGCFAKIFSQSLSTTYRRELKKVLKEFKPDIVIFHYPNPFVSTFLLPLLDKNTKLVLYWHLDITKQKLLGKLFHGQTMKLLQRATKVIATSPNYVDGSPYLNQFREKCIVVPNCISQERFKITDQIKQNVAEITKKYSDKIICLAVGRHVPYKGMVYLVRASKYLDDNFVVLIGGEGELTESLKAEAKGDKKVVFLGKLHNEELVSYYLASDIFAFPSITKNEAFGIALAEAMYFGKPAVTFTIPGSGVNYVNLNGVTGIECPNGDSKAFAEAIKKFADDESLRKTYGEAGRKRVQELFTYSQFKENIKNLLLSL